MSEFMLIAPDGGTQLDYEVIVNTVFDQNTMENLQLQGQLYEIDNAFKPYGLIPEGLAIQEIKFIDNAFMWVRFG